MRARLDFFSLSRLSMGFSFMVKILYMLHDSYKYGVVDLSDPRDRLRICQQLKISSMDLPFWRKVKKG